MWYLNFLRGSLRALVVCFLVAGGSFAWGDTILDDFSAPDSEPYQHLITGAFEVVKTEYPGGFWGGKREVLFEVGGTPDAWIVGQVGGGVLRLNSDSPGAIVKVTYFGGGGVADLSSLGDMFSLDFNYVNSNVSEEFVVEIDVWGVGGITATSSAVVDDSNTPSTTTINFADFTGDIAALKDAKSMVIRFNPSAYEHVDFSLDEFGVGIIPEPSTAVLLIGGLLTAMVYVRRRR